jgi:copper oxidase (laccase) domain-containing protein
MPTATTLRAATAADARTIAALHAASWRAAYGGILAAAYLERELDADRREIWGTLLRAT